MTMGYLKKMCIGAVALVGSALFGYFLYKNYFEEVEPEKAAKERQLRH